MHDFTPLRLSAILFALCVGETTSALMAAESVTSPPTLIRDYVNHEDSAYRWSIVSKVQSEIQTTLIVDLVSQRWRSPEEVDRTEWRHWLTIVVPNEVQFDTALLFIGGGSNDARPPQKASDRLKQLALHSKSVVAELRSVPNEPLTFAGFNRPLKEDAIIAFCLNRCIETGDYTWLARLPMVKSAVKAMDAVQEIVKQECATEAPKPIVSFVVAGASKRGWTTWLVPTVDKRVKAIVPMVIDVLNVRPSMAHHLAAYGKWSPALKDYERQQLLTEAAMDRSRELMAIDDPYTYRSLLELPKYVINASGDEYFVSDSWQFYFNDLPGEKHLRYIPNTGHSLDGTDVAASLLAFYQFILAGQPRPKYQWRLEGDGTIVLSATDKPAAVHHWVATNPAARDFRLTTLGRKFVEQPIEPDAKGEYRATISPPTAGWTAHFIEAEFAGLETTRLKVTSGIQINPPTLPFAEKARPLLEGAAAGR